MGDDVGLGDAHPQVVAHRGASHDHPEHTLGAYLRAIDAGADALECDVRMTADGHLVCVHDRRVDRTSSGRGRSVASTRSSRTGRAPSSRDSAGAGRRTGRSRPDLEGFVQVPTGYGACWIGCRRGRGGIVLTLAVAPVLFDRSSGGGRALRLFHDPAAVPVARREFVADVSDRLVAGVSDQADDGVDVVDVVDEAAVVVSELLGNAVRHAPALPDGGVLMRWQVQGRVVDVEVTDGGGASAVRPGAPSPSATSGRGLRLIGRLAHEWGVQTDDDGCRTVWAAVGGPSRRRHRG